MTDLSELLSELFRRLLDHHGPQHWWPGDTAFEMMVGAILTQATNWSNVEKAIANLKSADVLSPQGIRSISQNELAQLVYPSGYYNRKALKLKALSRYLADRFGDNIECMKHENPEKLRAELLAIYGIGQETADSILLYSVGVASFVVDNYTRRIFERIGVAKANQPYGALRSMFMDNLPADCDTYGEFHALIVRHGVEVCRRVPLCSTCPLVSLCEVGRATALLQQSTGR